MEAAPLPPPFALIPISAAHWQEARELRLEMLADTPLAYLERLETAQARTDAEWQQRAAQTWTETSCGFAAVDAVSGRWVGTARGAVFGEQVSPSVLSVYVTARFRGSGAADALMQAVEDWARTNGHDEIFLEVHEHNARAAAFYARRGYAFTGARRPYELEPSQWDLEMRASLVRPIVSDDGTV